MKAKTILIALVVLTLLTSLSYAKVWRLDKNDGNNPDFTTLADAVADAQVQNGDTLYLAGHPVSYGDATIEKKLYIFGSGYFLDENPETQAKPVSAKTGNITFATGSEGSLITGVETSKIIVNTNNISIKRNYIHSVVQYSAILVVSSSVSNIIIKQNYISNTDSRGWCISIEGSNENIIITNNFLCVLGTCISSVSSSTAYVKNNVFQGGHVKIHNSTFNNNIIKKGCWDTVGNSGNDVRNNIELGTSLEGFPSENGNQSNVDMSTVFVGSEGNSTDGQWQLAEGSPAIGAGVSGEDCGMFGGSAPYVLSGLPAIPAVYFLDAATTGSATSGLPVSIKVKSRK